MIGWRPTRSLRGRGVYSNGVAWRMTSAVSQPQGRLASERLCAFYSVASPVFVPAPRPKLPGGVCPLFMAASVPPSAEPGRSFLSQAAAHRPPPRGSIWFEIMATMTKLESFFPTPFHFTVHRALHIGTTVAHFISRNLLALPGRH